MDSEFLQLQQLFIQNLAGRKKRLEEALSQASQAEASSAERQEALRRLHNEAHKLTGAAGGYQLQQLSHKARAVERFLFELLKQEPEQQKTSRPQLDQEIQELLELIQYEREQGI